MIELNKTEQMLPKHEHYNTDLLNICIYSIQSLVLVSIVYAQINPHVFPRLYRLSAFVGNFSILMTCFKAFPMTVR